MTRKLLAALGVSLLVHAWLVGEMPALFSTEEMPEKPLLTATLRPLPPPPPSQAPAKAAAPAPVIPAVPPAHPSPAPRPPEPAPAVPDGAEAAAVGETLGAAPVVPPEPRQPSTGALRYEIFHEGYDLRVGRAEIVWQFSEDGRYQLHSISETSGMVAMFKRLRVETRSSGRLTAGGLQPEVFRTLRNGEETRERADFVWPTWQVVIGREGKTLQIAPGTQDLLSLNFQLAYLKAPEAGSRIGVVTGKKYQVYELDSLGEETVRTPAGEFRTLHLRASGETITEVWIAPDLYRLPVKIRFTDKKGDSYVQLASEIGQPVAEH